MWGSAQTACRTVATPQGPPRCRCPAPAAAPPPHRDLAATACGMRAPAYAASPRKGRAAPSLRRRALPADSRPLASLLRAPSPRHWAPADARRRQPGAASRFPPHSHSSVTTASALNRPPAQQLSIDQPEPSTPTARSRRRCAWVSLRHGLWHRLQLPKPLSAPPKLQGGLAGLRALETQRSAR